MIAMVILVMIVAAVNVTNLLLARAASRHRELAIRSALGAGRGRLVRQMVTESLVLAMLGGGAGVLLGTWVARALATMRLPGDLPVRFDFRLDGRVLAYSVTVAVRHGAARRSRLGGSRVEGKSRRHASRIAAGPIGHASSRGSAASSWRPRSLVASCFSRWLDCSCGALSKAERTDLGFQPEGVLNVHMDVGQLDYSDTQGRAFFDDVERRTRSIPGVQQRELRVYDPDGLHPREHRGRGRGPTGRPRQPCDRRDRTSSVPDTSRRWGSRSFAGGASSDADNEQSRPVAVVNQRFADMLWPGQDPIGRRFKSPGPSVHWIEVVGVAKTGKYQFLFEDPQPYFYVPIAQEYTGASGAPGTRVDTGRRARAGYRASN